VFTAHHLNKGGSAEVSDLGNMDCPQGRPPRWKTEIEICFTQRLTLRQQFIMHRLGVLQFCLPVRHTRFIG